MIISKETTNKKTDYALNIKCKPQVESEMFAQLIKDEGTEG